MSRTSVVEDASVATADSLYDRDFYAWTQEQAGHLRAGRLDALDFANILEEIETLGRKEVSELRSRHRVLAQHLLKLIYQPQKATRSWKTTILNQRIEIAGLMDDNPSLRAKAEQVFAIAYRDARRLAAAETGLPAATFPVAAPFSLDQALSESYDPGN